MKQTFKKGVSLLLAVLMVVSAFASMPITTFAAGVDYSHNASTSTDEYYNLVSKTDWDNAPGIAESEIILDNDAGDYRQVIHVMSADVNNSYVSVIPTYSEMNTSKYQTGTMLDQANWIDENMAGEVIGTMNCCLSWYTGYEADRVGEPLGFMMLNGEIMFDPGNCGYVYGNVGFPTCVVINKDFDAEGNPRPADIPKVEMPQIRSSADLDGWEDTVIPVSSGYIVDNGVNKNKASHKNDPAPRSVVGVTADGKVVMMENDGRQQPYSAGMNMYECAEVMIAAGCVWAANCDGGGSSTFVSQRPGETLKVNNSPSDGGLRPSTSGICFISTAPADGEFYRAHITTDSEYYTPGSAVQFHAIGTDMIGTETDIPAEAVWQLSDASFGTIDNNGLFTSNGKEGKVTAQLVYNGEVVGEATTAIVLPDIAFKNDTIVIGYGDTMVLPLEVTTNEGRNTVAYKPGDIVYTLSNNALGTLEGDSFTACDASTGLTEGTITAVICGQTDKTVTANIRFGKASEIAYDYEDGVFLVDEDPEVDPAEGEPYGWCIMDSRAAGHMPYRFFAKKNYTPVTYDIRSELYLVDRESGRVRNGNYAMGVDIDWTWVTASCHGQMEIFLPESLDLTDATSVGFWMYVPAEMVTASMQVRACFMKKGGGTVAVTDEITDMMGQNSGVENGGWFYFSWDVLSNYQSLEYIEINSHYTAGAGNYNYYQDMTYYIDDITVDYSDATIDRENPYFTNMTIADEYTNGVEVAGQTITSNNITLMAQAYENTAKTNATGLDRNSVQLYVDGVKSTADISTSIGGTITVSDLYLNDGVHTLVMEVSDNQGNVGNIVRELVVNTENSAVRLEVPASNGKLLPTGSLYWVNLVADDLADIESVTTTVTLDYVNDWELEGMEVAYGFKAEYYVNDQNDAVITFTRTNDEVADTTVLAKLPIRIWTAKGWLDDSGIRKNYISDDPKMQDKYYILTPHAMWYSDGTRDYRLVVGAEAGCVTYTDGSTETFSAKDTVIQTEMNRYYTNADRQGKWSFHICAPGAAQSKAATCTEGGYENRVFCEACACGTVDNLGTQCDNHNGCGGVIDWGTVLPATGHNYAVVDGVLTCTCGKVFNGVYTDGKTYIDGKVVADGWFEDTYYFIDGVKVTGQKLIDGTMCTFDENGVYQPNYSYTGFYHDGNGWTYYQANFQKKGFVVIDGNTHYFDDKTGYAPVGSFTLAEDRVYRVEGEQGKVLGGWDTYMVDGVERRRYYYSLRYYKNQWLEVDGDMYYFDNEGYALIGTRAVAFSGEYLGGYEFAMDGKLIAPITGPFVDYESGYKHFAEDGVMACNKLVKHGDDYYFARNNYLLITWATYIDDEQANGLLPAGEYQFGADGKLIMQNGPVADPFTPSYLNFYKNGVRVYEEGLYEFNGDYYYVRSNGLLLTWGMYISKTNGLLPAGEYKFGADGKLQMLNGPVPDAYSPAYLNFYKDGIRVYEEGLYKFNGDYYYVRSNGLLLTWGMNITKTNGLLPAGEYMFGEDGKLQMLNGPVEDAYNAAYLNFYKDGIRIYEEGLYEFNGDYYYVRSNGLLLTWGMNITKTNGLLPAGEYKFGTDGKLQMLNGPVVDAYNAAYLNFYKDGIRIYEEGLYEYNGDYYYVRSNGLLLTWGMYITKTNGLLPAGEYKFGTDGKLVMLNGPVADALSPTYLNFYKDGIRIYEEGLYEYEGDYYYVRSNGLLMTWGTHITEDKANGLVPAGDYEFGADGKMVK